MVEESCGRPD